MTSHPRRTPYRLHEVATRCCVTTKAVHYRERNGQLTRLPDGRYPVASVEAWRAQRLARLRADLAKLEG